MGHFLNPALVSRQALQFSTNVMCVYFMKTASPGLLELPVVRVNAEGDAPPDPPLLVTSRPFPLALFSSRKVFWRMSGKIFLVGGPLRSGRCMAHSLMSSTCKHVTTDRRETGDRGQDIKGCRASGVNSRRIRAAGL